jgi:hypothetical protein
MALGPSLCGARRAAQGKRRALAPLEKLTALRRLRYNDALCRLSNQAAAISERKKKAASLLYPQIQLRPK